MDKNLNPARWVDGWMEVFRAGRHTDSAGNEQKWSVADLEQMKNNFADPIPLVIGHPAQDDPAWGWSRQVKVEGESIWVNHFDKVDPTFEAWVQEGRYPNRSVRIAETEKGYELIHIGFLGAAPPALKGLQPIFSRKTLKEFNYNIMATDAKNTPPNDGKDTAVADKDTVVADKDTGKYVEQAAFDAFAQDMQSQLDAIKKMLEDMQKTEAEEDTTASTTSQGPPPEAKGGFTRHLEVERNALQQKIESLQAEIQVERSLRQKNEFSAFLRNLMDEGRLLPAQVDGLSDFMLQLGRHSFDFTAAEGKKQDALAYFKDFLKRTPVKVPVDHELDFSDAMESDTPMTLATQALEYINTQAALGRSVSGSEAIQQVKLKGRD